MLARAVWFGVLASIAVALGATVWFVVATLPVRIPYWGEAEVLFEATRLRAGLALYVDPLVGAHEYGEPASRFYVTYPPVWTWLVACLPDASAMVFGRVASTLAWFGSLAGLSWTARAESRREAAVAAAFVAGIWVLANFATIGRPDAMACAIAAFALARAMRRGRVDVLSAALFVLVPWVKPTIIGLPAGALAAVWLFDSASGPAGRGRMRMIGIIVVLVTGSAVLAHVASHGAVFAHVVHSNAQPFTLTAWQAQVPTRLPFFGPLIVWAGWVGWRDRARPGVRIGLAALAGAVLWTLFALAKTGSSSNYWMEPSIAAVALIAQSSAGPVRVLGEKPAHALAALGCVLWADVASVSGALEHTARMRADAALVTSIRARTGVGEADVIAADEAGIELVTNGRILTPTYQMVHLVRRGTYPALRWIADLTSPRTRVFVEHTHQLRLAPELQRALESHYEVAFEERGFLIWRRR